ncbi:MAG: endonuclease/exonuclease/phosphatase, partial [Anaerolineae bacterium]|nr:endonuclease/exonuclease/phosphatase [Anaerolineae bacterium]
MFKKQLWLAVLLVLALALPITSAGAAPPRQDDFGDCGDPATPIHEVQGTEDRTPFGGTTLTIEGVVVGDYQDTIAEFGGFYMQEEDADADADPLTSEGIFIDSKLVNVDVEVGDVVRVTGAAFELSADGANLTQLRRVKAITICDSGVSITPVEVELPVADLFDWEAYEGMLVTLPQTLTVSEVYNLGRYGEIKLSVDGRLYEPTNIARPGADALAVQAENNLRSIVLDDGNNQQNLDPTRYPAGGLSADNGLRDGDTVTGITGIVDQRYGMYLIQPAGPIEFETGNPRSDSPPDVGGSLKAASFNVLNYFNGDGQGGGFPTSRGAGTADEFDRQRDKIINAIV